jgi:endonuclease YncB( thermonuclease family)
VAAAIANSDNRRRADDAMKPTQKPQHRRLMTICVLALLVEAAATAAQSRWAPLTGRITRVIDGEAIEVRIGERLEIVRYIGIGTPEILHPSGGPDRYREAARAANARLVADTPVQLVFDMQVRDRTGRLLAYVYAGDVFLNAELVGAGYAEVATSPPNVRHREAFMARQRDARQAKRGLWADPDVARYHRPRPAGVYGDTRLQIYFHLDDGGRNLLPADPFVIFESPQQAAAAGYRPSMDYASYARREKLILSGEPLPVTTGTLADGTAVESPRSYRSYGSSGSSGAIEVVPPSPAPGYRPAPGPYFTPYGPR